MSIAREKEFEVNTVGELRKAIEGVPDDTPVEDGMGETTLVTWLRDEETNELTIEVR